MTNQLRAVLRSLTCCALARDFGAVPQPPLDELPRRLPGR
jgi:hypothetical protein